MSSLVPDYMEATSATERYDVLERELRRRSAAKGATQAKLAAMVPPRAITEVATLLLPLLGVLSVSDGGWVSTAWLWQAYLRHTVTHPVLRPVRLQEAGTLGQMLWHDIYEEEVASRARAHPIAPQTRIVPHTSTERTRVRDARAQTLRHHP